jgi:hypothetical protein
MVISWIFDKGVSALYSFQLPTPLRRARVSGQCYPRNRQNSLSLLLATAPEEAGCLVLKTTVGREAKLRESLIGDRRQGRADENVTWLEPNFRLTLCNVEIAYRSGRSYFFHLRGIFMNLIKRAGAWCNGEVAYLAWDVEKQIKGCVGFMVTRVHETGKDAGKRRILPTWIAFTDQNNPNWNEQDSSVWPIQNFHWRDLTLRKSRDTTTIRPIDFKVHYEIVPVALADASQKDLPPSSTAPAKDAHGQPSYLGPAHPLVAIGKPIKTNTINVTHTYGKNVKATFTNGILSTQNLVRQLESVKKGPSRNAIKDANSDEPAERAKAADQKENHLLKTLKDEIQRPDSKIREFLMGDVYKFVTELVDRARKERGQVYLALYELHDKQLIKLLVDAVKSKLIHIILTTAGNLNPNPMKAKKGAKKRHSKKNGAKAK